MYIFNPCINRHGNFGDDLSYYIVSKMSCGNVHVLGMSDKIPEDKMTGIGSVLQYAKADEAVWGTGTIPFPHMNGFVKKPLNVTALRGPLSRGLLVVS